MECSRSAGSTDGPAVRGVGHRNADRRARLGARAGRACSTVPADRPERAPRGDRHRTPEIVQVAAGPSGACVPARMSRARRRRSCRRASLGGPRPADPRCALTRRRVRPRGPIGFVGRRGAVRVQCRGTGVAGERAVVVVRRVAQPAAARGRVRHDGHSLSGRPGDDISSAQARPSGADARSGSGATRAACRDVPGRRSGGAAPAPRSAHCSWASRRAPCVST